MGISLIVPEGYKPSLDVISTEIAIKKLKDFFEAELANELKLIRVSAPLFVRSASGLNDDLNGIEKPVSFTVPSDDNAKLEIVHSLAKWKRMALGKYNFETGRGLYTDMNAIRPDEDLDNIHSIYVDQWDWEKVLNKEERTEETLINTIKSIFKVFKKTEDYICNLYPQLNRMLPDEISIITSQELEDKYPTLTPKEREHAIAKEKKAVFITKIGHVLASGEKHDGRAPDYDDWNLNGDIIFWNPILNQGLELSSMGIRVSEESLIEQLKIANCEERLNLEYHKLLSEKKLPYTIGGGIGQSRICMYFLQKAHIGEVQASIWPECMIEECKKSNIFLL
ncbi:aspartate--ammonia ligase AsnA [Gottschalkia purinilytica]|uniref:Aspartate--ammonia ligase n=1 Tax=Gottschalkia purinilytica TaxID=1503 RepID=A0A0L0WEW7_GOTPU|nr:aspartate--ammonia ligase [Gottschalkia purinilytica]KNF09960.1 aspartate--ammonia ligase AsnA [Gottschalkia purinilytica]